MERRQPSPSATEKVVEKWWSLSRGGCSLYAMAVVLFVDGADRPSSAPQRLPNAGAQHFQGVAHDRACGRGIRFEAALGPQVPRRGD